MIPGRRSIATVSVLGAACLSVAGCSTNGLASLPLPHPGEGRGGYAITAVFASALNLPAFAKVRLAGADIGQLEKIEARNYTAVATLRISRGVQLPAGSTVELRSATPLGDVFISVKPPEDAGPGARLLKDGDTIGIENTAAAATVENLLTGAAILVNGGAVQNLTDVINGAGRAAGADGGRNFGRLVDDTNRLLATMNGRTGQISDSLTALSVLSDRMDEKNQAIAELLTAAAPANNTLAQHTTQIADLVLMAGDASRTLEKIPSIGGTDTSSRSVIADLNTMSRSFNDVILDPTANLASANRLMPPLIKSTAGSALSLRVSVDRLILGHIPDIGFPGDDGFHGPKWSTFNQLIGSFKYTLLRLQERVVGRGPDVAQVPVQPSPTEPGQWEVLGPPPGPTLPGQFVTPAPTAQQGPGG